MTETFPDKDNPQPEHDEVKRRHKKHRGHKPPEREPTHHEGHKTPPPHPEPVEPQGHPESSRD